MKNNSATEPYQVLARRYRPTNFSELKGQESFSKIIINSIKQNKLAHSYLLTGIRGVGKTTIARIIARTINCSNLNLNSGKLDPCGECANCIAAKEGSHPDIIEVDAASKTGVNDVREIIEATKFKPLLGKYKVYIIDEVHMLSNGAFNALLKTLEEPPEGVIFIFATTEFRKIPLTIISRCQKFDLHRFSIKALSSHLKDICQKEKILIEEEALNLVAKFSEGSIRDSLSLLETVNMYKKCDEQITLELISDVLGLPDVMQIYKLLNFIIEGNPKEAIDCAKNIYNSGIEVTIILNELLSACSKIAKSIALKHFIHDIDLSSYEKNLILSLSKKIDLKNITTIWKMFLKGLEEAKYYDQIFDLFEMLIIRICYLSTQPSLEEIISDSGDSVFNKNNKCLEANKDEGKLEQNISKFIDVVELFRKNKEIILYTHLVEEIEIIQYKPGLIKARTNTDTPKNFISLVTEKLKEWTDMNWIFNLEKVNDNRTVTQTIKQQKEEVVNNSELVKEVVKSFPGAKVKTSIVN